jgi:hypothetical protein
MFKQKEAAGKIANACWIYVVGDKPLAQEDARCDNGLAHQV